MLRTVIVASRVGERGVEKARRLLQTHVALRVGYVDYRETKATKDHADIETSSVKILIASVVKRRT